MAHQLGSKKYVTGLKSEKRRKKDPRLAVWMGAFLSWLCSTTMVPHTPFYIEEDEEVPFFDFTSCSAPASTEASQVILLSWRGPATTQVLHVRVQHRCIVAQVQHLLQPAWERAAGWCCACSALGPPRPRSKAAAPASRGAPLARIPHDFGSDGDAQL
jgi:hypothetical protein